MTWKLKRLLKRMLPALLVFALAGFVFSLLFGDGCGPVERGIRAALGTWDMWETPLVAPYEEPLRSMPEGVVPLGQGADPYREARSKVAAMDETMRQKAGALAYRRFCHHCHGPKGDNRIIVGESFGFRLPNLRGEEIQSLDDREIFSRLTHGSKRMIPLAATLSAVDRLLVIEHLRTLPRRPSRPFFKPRWVEPAEQPGGPRK